MSSDFLGFGGRGSLGFLLGGIVGYQGEGELVGLGHGEPVDEILDRWTDLAADKDHQGRFGLEPIDLGMEDGEERGEGIFNRWR